MPLLRIAPLLVTMILGCSGTIELEHDVPHGAQGPYGLVYVNYSHDWSDEEEATLLTSSAQFVRYSAMDRDQVARLLALPLDPRRDLPALEQCKTYDMSVESAAEEVLEEEEVGNVELLEAGDLQIQSAQNTLTLSPRHFPWLLPFISGVIYGEAQANAVNEVGVVRVAAAGGRTIGAFTESLTSPRLPRIQKVGHAAPSALVYARPGPLALHWGISNPQELAEANSEVQDASGTPITYAEVRYVQGKRDLVLRCRMEDDGYFELPLSREIQGRVTLEIVRLRWTPFRASGLHFGELHVGVRDRAVLQL